MKKTTQRAFESSNIELSALQITITLCFEFNFDLQSEGGDIVKKIKGIFCFKVSDGPGGERATWFVDCKNGNGSVTRGGESEF